jgi:Tol biopolymer transport system component
VWINGGGIGPKPRLIYDVPLAEQSGGLNFIPVWDPRGRGFVFFQDGKLVYYDVQRQEAAIWHKPLAGKLRSAPVFSPNEEAVAFVDNQGRGYSEYRLLVINPRLQPVEHIVQTKTGFKVLAWLPD